MTSLKKHHKALLHILAWAILFLLPFIFAPEVEVGAPRSVHVREFLYVNTIPKVFWLLLFYLNTVVLIPGLLYKSKYVIFVLFQVLLFVGIIGVRSVYYEMIVPKFPFVFYQSAFHNSMPFLFTVLSSIAYKTVLDRLKNERLANEKQRENLKTELSIGETYRESVEKMVLKRN